MIKLLLFCGNLLLSIEYIDIFIQFRVMEFPATQVLDFTEEQEIFDEGEHSIVNSLTPGTERFLF